MTTTILDIDPRTHVVRSSGEGIEFSPEAIWRMLHRCSNTVVPHIGTLLVVPQSGEGRVIISRPLLGYLTAKFAPHF